MKKLINELNDASYQYYNFGTSSLSDAEYDLKLNQLKQREKETGIIYSNSPTQKVGYPVLNNLKKVKIINKPMLSLEKIYSNKEIQDFAGKEKIIGMIKCDGLSVRLIYQNGQLISANTIGTGFEGGDITEHIKHFLNVPLKISFINQLIVDGEAIIKNKDFEEINQKQKFSNSRNAAAGSLNLLDMKEVSKRKLSFIAWDCINGIEENSFSKRIDFLNSLGFETIFYSTTATNEEILNKAKELDIPCDGVVWKIDNISNGEKRGKTEHHFLNAVAWKPAPDTYESYLINIEWSLGRTGVLTPIAIINEIEIEGVKINRCSLHNISVMKELLGKAYSGQRVEVYRANQVIPQVLSAGYPESSADIEGIRLDDIPNICPICGGPTYIEKKNDSEVLKCGNPDCCGQLLTKLDHYCSKKGLDIKGLSRATLEKLIDWGWVNEIADLYKLELHKEEWILKPGFGKVSVNNALTAIQMSRIPKLEKFICALGIPLVGTSLSKELAKHFKSYEELRDAAKNHYDFTHLDKVAYEKASALWNFDWANADLIAANILGYEQDEAPAAQDMIGEKICITGTLRSFRNRDELTKVIEAHGGKVVSSVSSQTTWLINNNISSISAKNKAAERLGIPIITEEEFINHYALSASLS